MFLGNDKVENDQPPDTANVPLRSTGEQMVTEPPSTDKSVEMSESVSASHSQADNHLPPKELRPLKLPLEAASELKTSKLSGISEKQHLRILEEAFRGSEPHVLHHHILCAKKSCKSLSSNEISRQLPSKPHVFKHGSMMTLYSAVKVVYGGWHLKRVRECFVVFVRSILKQPKM